MYLLRKMRTWKEALFLETERKKVSSISVATFVPELGEEMPLCIPQAPQVPEPQLRALGTLGK